MEMTVVFADLSSFTEMTGRLGATTTYSVVDEFLRLASTTLMSHGAFIDKYIGDAVMALFNVPIKRADHAAAAVAAAAKLQELLPELSERLGMPLQASIGIASGFARVGRLGSDDIKDYTAIGDVVNQAARLQAQAGPNEILVSQDVYREVASAYPGVPAETLVQQYGKICSGAAAGHRHDLLLVGSMSATTSCATRCSGTGWATTTPATLGSRLRAPILAARSMRVTPSGGVTTIGSMPIPRAARAMLSA